jgi:hypothetical protein
MKQKVAIGWPDGGSVTGAFTLALVELFRFEMMNPNDDYELVQPLRQSSLYIQNNRNNLVMDARDVKADWLLQIDGDHHFAPNMLRVLMSTADKITRPIVAGLYSNIGHTNDNASVQIIDCVYGEVENGQYRALTVPDDMQPFQCDAIGSGILLVHMSVFYKLKFPWFWVELFQDPQKLLPQPMNEDIAFCRYARSEGYQIWCDPRPDIAHWKSLPLTPSTMRKFLTKAWAVKDDMEKVKKEN